MSKGLPRSVSKGSPKSQEIIKQRFIVKNGVVAVTSVTTAIGFGSLVIGDFPEGNILFLGAVSYFSFTGSGADANLVDTWNGDYAVGTVPTADVDLADATDFDIITSTAIGPATAEAIGRTRGVNATQAIFDNTDGSLELNLNVLIDAADIGDSQTVNLTVNGELEVLYSVLGDD